jgi:hypothetical protein
MKFSDKTAATRLTREKYLALVDHLCERSRRLWAATEAQSLGRGGIAVVCEATGLSDRTIRNGIQEINTKESLQLSADRQRRGGGGRKRLEEEEPKLLRAIEALIEPDSRGDPVSPLRWTCKSTRAISETLAKEGLKASPMKIHGLLRQMGYSMQSNRKSVEGKQHPDRNAQFEFIAKRVKTVQRRRDPALSVDTKKKELIGLKKNAGKVLVRKGQPTKVEVHDFPDEMQGKAVPYGVYDISLNEALVSIGNSGDTAEFAVAALRMWWKKLGRKKYKKCKGLLITADSGGSNSYRNRLWKLELQRLANELGAPIEVCHYPPGTSKWNKIEHRLFCHITRSWQGVPLESLEIIVKLIGATRTREGLEVHAWIDDNIYETGRKVTDEELEACTVRKNKFHGEWNYTILPNRFR